MKFYRTREQYLLGYPSIAERNDAIVNYIADCGSTIRETADIFRISKSTVYVICRRYMDQNPYSLLTKKIKALFIYHNSIRHLNGGEMTRLKFQRAQLERELD